MLVNPNIVVTRYLPFLVLLITLSFIGCQKGDSFDENGNRLSTDQSDLRTYKWNEIILPLYNWQEGVTFAGNLHVDVEYDFNGVKLEDDLLHFHVDPILPIPAATSDSPHNFRSEIRTAPWEIKHAVGSEQWIGWSYTFGDNYVIDSNSPITIYQNHPAVRGISPAFEIEIAKASDSNNTIGGEIIIVNKGSDERMTQSVRPVAGEVVDIVVHVVYGMEGGGLLQIWLNEELVFDKKVATIYNGYQWGGNNKWGIYHHTFNNNPERVQASLDIGAGVVDLYMGTLRMITRKTDHSEYMTNAYHFVKPD